jgi:hypothetical protein
VSACNGEPDAEHRRRGSAHFEFLAGPMAGRDMTPTGIGRFASESERTRRLTGGSSFEVPANGAGARLTAPVFSVA